MDSSSTLLQKFQLDTLYKIRLELQLEPPPSWRNDQPSIDHYPNTHSIK